MSDGRTAPPTARRLRDARRRGVVPLSRDAVAVAALAAGGAALALALPRTERAFAAALAAALRAAASPAPAATAGDLAAALSSALGALAPPLAAALLAAVAATALQTRFLVTPGAALPRAERIDPRRALTRLALARTWAEPAWQLARGVAVVLAGASALSAHPLGRVASARALAARLGALAGDAALRMLAAATAIAVLDVAWRRWLHVRDLRMTREEVRREAREDEGPPELRGARDRLRREAAEEPLPRAVAGARCVVWDGARNAAALRYDAAADEAPAVVATGHGERARAIVAAAGRVGVPVVEDAALAGALAAVDPGGHIPSTLYEPVAAALGALA